MLLQSPGLPQQTCPRCQGSSTSSSSSSPSLSCSSCSAGIHLDCLSSPIPALKGDTFFSITCDQCSASGTDEVSRKRISWLGATLLSLYHLHLTEAPSNLGFYHWRTDVARLIATHWADIFGPAVKKKKTWQGSVSGSLSGNASTLFESGLCTIGEQGWWRLRSLDPPALQLSRLAPKVVASRQAKPVEGVEEVLGRRGDRGSCSSLALAIARKEARDGLVAIPMANKKEKVRKKRGEKRRLLEENLEVEYAADEEEEVKVRFKICEDHEEEKSDRFDCDGQYYENVSTTSLLKVSRMNNLLEPGPSRSPSVSSSSATSCPSWEAAVAPSSPPESPCPPDPSPVSPSPNSPSVTSLLDDDTASIEEMGDAAIDEDVIGSLVEEGGNLLNLLFENQDVTNSTTDESQKGSQDLDNENMEANISSPGAIIASDLTSHASDVQRDFSEEETLQHLPEEQAQDQLHESDTCKNPAVGEVPLVPSMNRFHQPGSSCDNQREAENGLQVLDRFQHHGSSAHLCRSLVVEAATTDWSVSPFSGARLSPFIRRDTETEPAGLAVLRKFDSFATRLHPIDFCYLQPQLVPAVNCLAEKLFWPGIDLGEGLLFPDFSCVALYKRLCVGFGLVVPDCRWSESYLSHLAVHPAWRGNGLATFMLYHLIQTNLGKDLTLHVSASNPALLLYQKFGFKVEEFVSNFYTRYLPPDSQQSPHALFLRLAR